LTPLWMSSQFRWMVGIVSVVDASRLKSLGSGRVIRVLEHLIMVRAPVLASTSVSDELNPILGYRSSAFSVKSRPQPPRISAGPKVSASLPQGRGPFQGTSS
jgi:hypothetical protein